MLTGLNFVAGNEVACKGETFRSQNPQDGIFFGPEVQIASSNVVADAVSKATSAFRWFVQTSPNTRAALLVALGQELERHRSEIVELAHRETGLPIDPRLNAELTRAIGCCALFAEYIRSGEQSRVHIVTELPERQPARRPDLRTRRIGIGPVVVFAASNFPLAFGTLGGDTISALAAGCSVIVKAHPGHPGTSELLARCFYRAAEAANVSPEIFSLLQGMQAVGEQLVSNRDIRGVGFTGSRRGGIAIQQIAAKRTRPLDSLSLEMGSVNPLFIYPEALHKNGSAIASGLAAAVLLGCGQFCTKPGLVFYVGGGVDSYSFVSTLKEKLLGGTSSLMLNRAMKLAYQQGAKILRKQAGVTSLGCCQGSVAIYPEDSAHVLAELFHVSFQDWINDRDGHLREELFGPATLLVECANTAEFLLVAEALEGELTATVHITPEVDRQELIRLRERLELLVGRVIVNGYPPGVEVCDAMNHSGPWPAGFGNVTVVGPTSIERWLRVVCYQDLPNDLRPAEVQDVPPVSSFVRVQDGKRV